MIAQRVHSTLVMLLMAAIAGCGTAVQRSGTEQLLLSDSVDRAVDQLDLSPLAGKRVYLDTEYMKAIKGNMFVNSEYIASAMRQKMTMSGCLIQTDKNAADYVLEARIGALGSDSMEVTYGIPSSNGIGQAATAITGFPSIAAIPEISVGKRNASIGVSKVMVYAYHRETGIPVWQSGDAIARSNATDSWMFGIGPLSRGSVYKSYRLAGIRLGIPFFRSRETDDSGPLSIADSHNFMHPAVLEKQLADAKAAEEAAAIRQAGHEEEIQKQ
ncbi:MAG: hypothetical protein KDA91_12610 [Planctomycetaceae bacterium]|nr:hypothetical protein [Planctomycetaceae bacterium]